MNNETIEIKKDRVLAAHRKAQETHSIAVREFLEDLFGADFFNPKDVRDRIKTFEDAMMALGEEHPLVQEWHLGENLSPDLEAYLQLRVIIAALNEGWEPQFGEDEVRYYPWHWLYTQGEIDQMSNDERKGRHMISTDGYQTEYAGFASAHSISSPSYASTSVGSRLCLKSDALAEYCGKQFTNLWADFLLIRK